MKTIDSKGLYLKLIGVILISNVIVFGIMSTLTVMDHRNTLTRAMESEASTALHLLSKISGSAFQNDEYALLDEMSAEASQNPRIVYVCFFDTNGKMLSQSDCNNTELASVLPFEKEIFESGNEGSDPVGILRLGFDTSLMRAELRREIIFMALYSLIGLILISAIVLLLSTKLINQMKQAARTTDTILKNLPFGMVVVGRDKIVRSVNQAALNIMQLDNDRDLIGKACHNSICPAEECSCPVLDLGQAVDSSEKIVLGKDGRKIPVMKSVIQINLENEDVLLEAFADVSKLKEAETALRESEKRLRTVMEACADPIVVCDHTGAATYVNPSFERVFGWRSDEILTNSIDFIPDEARSEAINAVEKLRKGRSFYGVETVRKSKDGKKITVRLSAAPIKDEDGQYNGMVVNLHDITALVNSRKAAEAATVAKSEFLANMSHEIRTPMNGVIGMVGLLLDTELSNEQRRYAEIVRVSGESLLGLINDILDYSKIEAKKLDMEMLNFDLRNLLEDFTETLALQAHEKGLELICFVEPDVPNLLNGDPGRLRQILNNIVGNAVKFTKDGEVSIWVSVEAETDRDVWLRFMIRDTGIGIPEEKIGQLFNDFQQVDASTTRKYGGTGLGLAISRQLAELMDGEAGVQSKVGKCSEFWFTVLLEKQADKQRMPTPPVNLENAGILIVDDNATNREILMMQLSAWKMRVSSSEDGPGALNALYKALDEKEKISIAAIDMQMPGMDGEAVCRAIKADERLSHTKLVLLSSMGVPQDPKRFAEIGFDAYLTKPIRKQELKTVLSQVLSIDGKSPIASDTVITQNTVKKTVNLLNGIKARILLAEDNITNQQVALGILRKFGLTADAVGNGKEVIKSLEQIPYDVVLMDVQMPEMDGLEATRQIRDPDSPVLNHDIIIIAMTAHTMAGDRERCLKAGMNGYVSKPIDPRVLAEELEKWLTKKTVKKPDDRRLSTITKNKSPGTKDKEAGAGPDAVVQDGADPSEHNMNVFNPQAFLDRLLGDEDFAITIIEGFLGDMQEQIASLKGYLADGDVRAMQSQAHKIKGAASNVTGKALEKTAAAMELSGKKDDLEALNQLMPEIEQRFQELKKAMEEYLK